MAVQSALSMIRKASQMPTWAKILAYGPTGTGKTVNGLMMPSPILAIDVEKGSVHYGDAYDFYVQRTRDLNVIRQTLVELRDNKCYLIFRDDEGKETDRVRIMSVVVDSGTTLYNLVNQRWIQKFQRDSKNPAYKLEGADYTQIKNDFKFNFINTLLDMEVHVYFICQQAANYLPLTYMKVDASDPYRPDIEKSTPHDFDVVLQMEKHGDDFRAVVKKSRIIDPKTRLNALPDVFEHVDKDRFIPELVEFITKKKVHNRSQDEKKQMEIKTNAEMQLDDLRKEVYALIEKLGWEPKRAQEEMLKQIGCASPKLTTFTLDKAERFIAYLHEQLLLEEGGSDGVDNTEQDVA